MIAYYVHTSEAGTDVIYLPERKCLFKVDRDRMTAFTAADPQFDYWKADNCFMVAPENIQSVIALREGKAEVHVLNTELWQQRLAAHREDA